MIARLFCALSALALTSSCVSITVGTDDAGLEMDGIVNGYVSAAALRAYDGDIIRFGFLDDTKEDELLSFDLWPLVGFGVGVAGARIRILPFELAIGTLFYSPKNPHYKWAEEDGDSDECEEVCRPEEEPAECEESVEAEEPKRARRIDT